MWGTVRISTFYVEVESARVYSQVPAKLALQRCIPL